MGSKASFFFSSFLYVMDEREGRRTEEGRKEQEGEGEGEGGRRKKDESWKKE